RDRLLEGQRISTDVRRPELNLWRSDVGKLGNRQPDQCNDPDYHHQYCNDHGHYRSVNKEFCHWTSPLLCLHQTTRDPYTLSLTEGYFSARPESFSVLFATLISAHPEPFDKLRKPRGAK